MNQEYCIISSNMFVSVKYRIFFLAKYQFGASTFLYDKKLIYNNYSRTLPKCKIGIAASIDTTKIYNISIHVVA